MATIVVTGAAGATGRRVVPLLRQAGHAVRAVDRDRAVGEAGATVADLREGVDGLMEGADAVVHLATPADGSAADLTRIVLEAADQAGVGRLVHRSGAVVYGAWPTNPVPLTEDQPLRPNPGFAPAADLAEAERLVACWADAHPDAAVTVLRPALVLAPDDDGVLPRLIGPAAHRRAEPPVVQYLSADDLAGAVAHVIATNTTGVCNVAPRGWISGDQVLALGGGHRLPIPDVVRDVAHRILHRLHLRRRPPAATPLLTHPWVVASDRLQGSGWEPASTSEEVVVAARTGSWWRELSPNRRQEVTLAASAAALAALAGMALVSWRRWGAR